MPKEKSEEKKPIESAKRRKHHRSSRVCRTIRQLQKRDKPVLQTAPLEKKVRDELKNYVSREKGADGTKMRITKGSIEILRCATEAYMVKMGVVATALASHAGRTTVQPADVFMWRKIRPEANIPLPDNFGQDSQ